MNRLTAICVRYPWATLGVVAALTIAAGTSIVRSETAVGIDAYLGAEHPAVRRFTEFLRSFGGGYPLVIAFSCADQAVCSRVFDPAALLMASTVSEELEKSRFVSRVSSPATTRLLVPSTDFGIDARQFVVDGEVRADPELVRVALSDPLWSRTLVSSDGHVGAIVVEMTSTKSPALLGIMEEVRAAIQPFAAHGFQFYLVGEPVMWMAAHEDSVASAMRVGIGTGGLLFVTLLILIRSLPAVIATLATIGVSSAWTMGMLPLLGWQQSVLTSGAATLILIIGCADCIHFASHYLETSTPSSDTPRTLEATTRAVLAPCFITTATTAGSFVSFASGGVHSLVQFGLLAAIGVSLAFVLTFSLLPALLVVLPKQVRSRRHSAAWQEILGRLASFGTRRRRVVLLAAAVLGLVGTAGMPKLRVELNPYELWSPDSPIQRALTFVSSNLQGPDRLEIQIVLPEGARIEDPLVLDRLAAVHTKLDALDGLGEPRSILTILRHTDDLLRQSTGAATGLGSEQGVGELLTLVTAGDPSGSDLWLTLDHRLVRVSVEARSMPSDEKARLVGEVRRAVSTVLPANWHFSMTGPAMLMYYHDGDFRRSQTTIVSASTLIVFVLIGLYLRSLPWALLAMVPNAVSLLLLFGAMGHWGVNLDFGSAIVAPIAIGIAADDTIHFLTAYARERRSGLDAVSAVKAAILGVGEAVIATSIALALGFLSMMTSPFPSIGNIGVLGAIAIIAATLADLLVLPALIATVASWKSFGGLPGRHG